MVHPTPQTAGANSEQTLSDQLSAAKATNATCDLADLVDAWSTYTHLTTPELDTTTAYTLDAAAVPGGLFAYFSCADTT